MSYRRGVFGVLMLLFKGYVSQSSFCLLKVREDTRNGQCHCQGGPEDETVVFGRHVKHPDKTPHDQM